MLKERDGFLTRNSKSLKVSHVNPLLVILMILCKRAFLNVREKNGEAITFLRAGNKTSLRHMGHAGLLNGNHYLWDIYETYGTGSDSDIMGTTGTL